MEEAENIEKEVVIKEEEKKSIKKTKYYRIKHLFSQRNV